MKLRSLWVMAVCWVGVAAAAPSTTARLEATRTSGPAPLAVQFDASATTGAAGSLPFHQFIYEFDFGDERGQTWGPTGAPKNVQRGGPLSAHVFDRPGTYTVKVRVQDGDGATSEVTTTVTVQDPATVYARSRTVCVSDMKNFDGCPAGASRKSEIPDSLGGKRVLLRRGESFPAVKLRNDDSNFQIGAFGEGDKPRIGGLASGMDRSMATWANDFTVMDLNIGAGSVNIDATVARFLLYRNDVKTPGSSESMVNIGSSAGYYQQNGKGEVATKIYWPREVFIVDNDIQGAVNPKSLPNLVVMGHFYKSALLGNTIDFATEHSLRVWAASKLVISHNRIGGNHHAPTLPGTRGAVKIHSAGSQPFTTNIVDSPKPATSQVILSNNVIGSRSYPGSFLSGFGPQNADPGTVEGLEDCISENNVYVRGANSTSDMQIRGRRMTARGNTVQGGKAASISRIGVKFDPGMDAWDGPYFFK
jgi:PKD repeat protein